MLFAITRILSRRVGWLDEQLLQEFQDYQCFVFIYKYCSKILFSAVTGWGILGESEDLRRYFIVQGNNNTTIGSWILFMRVNSRHRLVQNKKENSIIVKRWWRLATSFFSIDVWVFSDWLIVDGFQRGDWQLSSWFE